MEIQELSEEEVIALVGLLELVGASESDIPDEEAARINSVARQLGEDRYRAAAAEVDRRFRNEGELKAFLSTITRQPARELIYGIVFETAIPGAIDTRESKLLDWLAKEWNIEPTFTE